jgi:hypothetical protein
MECIRNQCERTSSLSDYERIRAKNIERNNARLRALGLISSNEEEQSNAFAWKKKSAPIQKSGVGKKRKRDDQSVSSRKSLRLQGKQPNGTELPEEEPVKDNDEIQKERQGRILECRKVRLRRALEVSEAGAERAAKENPTASYEHCLMRVRTMTEKGLINRVKAIERAAGKHSVIKMAIFKSCLQDEGLWNLAELASRALERLKALKPPIEDE